MITWDNDTCLASVKCPGCKGKPALVIEADDYTSACEELRRRGWQVHYYESIAICPEHKIGSNDSPKDEAPLLKCERRLFGKPDTKAQKAATSDALRRWNEGLGLPGYKEMRGK